MWSWEKKEDASYKTAAENFELKNELEQVKGLAARLQAQLDEIQANVHKVGFEFDFKGMRAFSIERNTNNNVPCTVIGYLQDETEANTDANGMRCVVTNTKVREWYLYCDEVNHKRLADEFRKAILK